MDDKTCDDDMEDLDPAEIKEHFESAVTCELKNRVKMGRPADRRAAVMTIANRQPKLHQAWLMACNSSKMGRRLIEEKYDQMPQPAGR